LTLLDVTDSQREASRLTKDEWREYTKTVWQIANVSHAKHPAVFPVEIPIRLVKLFSFVGETVLDPFAGTGTTGHAAVLTERRAVCMDQSPAYVTLMESWRKSLNGNQESVSVLRGDARDLRSHLKDDSVALAITSPPYWNKAKYGDGKDNLGNIKTYPAFIRSLRPAFEEVHRVLIPGRKLAVVTANVNQHTDHGLLTFPLATDISILLREIGFVLINEIIWSKDGTGGRWGSANHQRPIFGSYPYPPNFLFKNIHEYIIIVAKPSGRAAKGKTVLPYADLMELSPRE
jgi:site-specific DNA-methyltransferase (adenine-specific)